MPFRRYLRLQEKRIRQADQALGIQREHIPSVFLNLPNTPATPGFMRLATAIRNIPANFPICFITQEAQHWFRCIQLYWEAIALALAYKIHPLPMPDPLAENQLIQTELIPAVSYEHMQLMVESYIYFFNLLKAGESYLYRQAILDGCPSPFQSIEALFVQILRIEFEIGITSTMVAPEPILQVRKNQRNHHRGWLHFFHHRCNREQEKNYEKVLAKMGWKGYVLSVLRSCEKGEQLQHAWNQWLKSQQAFAYAMDHAVFWVNEVPFLSDTSKSGRRTNSRFQISSSINDAGYIDWYRRDV